ncbi:MAG: creatininase family protein [Solirubrobacterales bacterium]
MVQQKDVCLGLMTWPEIQERLAETDIALIPVGQIEQHGFHAGIDLDSRNAEGIAIRAAQAAFDNSKPVVTPTINYGYSDLPGLRDYPGVFSLRGETLINLCYDVGFSLIRMGFKKIVYVNGHDANPPFINEAMRRLIKRTGAFCAMAHISEMNNDYALKVLERYNMPNDFGHGCIIETSIAMAFGMEVREDKMEGHYTEKYEGAISSLFPNTPKGISFPAWECRDVMTNIWRKGFSGPKGNPEGSSVELGEELVKETIKPLVYLIETLKEYEVNVKKDIEFDI